MLCFWGCTISYYIYRSCRKLKEKQKTIRKMIKKIKAKMKTWSFQYLSLLP
ncbi:Uncharacterized protein TCM_031211 isoform 1 [Theobroma cacao]|uniref:Uncharacterized protein isoform 1 n=1 Tax=Theobroma cacao TaxID=3641 RepID=A0A061F5U5_THECC|nr:Uncharacterized protein TCM_031211 isoform 1 [Theobroma cacao]